MKIVRIHPAARHPLDPRALFVLVLCLVSGLPLVLGVIEPGSIAEALPRWAVVTWGGLLAGGAGVTIVGMSRQTALGVILEQVGSVTVGAATVFYASVIINVVGIDAALSSAIIAGWGAANFWRWFQLQSYLSQMQEKADHTLATETVPERIERLERQHQEEEDS